MPWQSEQKRAHCRRPAGAPAWRLFQVQLELVLPLVRRDAFARNGGVAKTDRFRRCFQKRRRFDAAFAGCALLAPALFGSQRINWRDPLTGKWERTFAVVTVPANELVAQIHDRMLAILPNDRFARWLSDEADPRELLVPFPADELAVSPPRSRR
jgi:hypothetical protein